MLHKTKGIVLHTTEYSESSIIAKIFTAQFGLQSYLVNSVRSRKAKTKASLFQPLTLAELVVYHKAEKGLQRISEITSYHFFHSIPFDVVKSSIAIFLAEVIYRSVKEEEAHPDLFHFLETAVINLDMHEYTFSNYPCFLLAQLTKYLGGFPSGNYNEQNKIFNLQEGVFQSSLPAHPFFADGKSAELVSTFLKSTFENHQQIEMSQSQRNEILTTFITYYELHHMHGTKLKSHLVLKDVLE